MSIIGTSLFTDVDATHHALVFAAKLHSDPRQRVGVYLLGRGYVGNMKIDDRSIDETTNGYRFEAGVSIPSANRPVHRPRRRIRALRNGGFSTRINTNLVMLSFVYRGRGEVGTALQLNAGTPRGSGRRGFTTRDR